MPITMMSKSMDPRAAGLQELRWGGDANAAQAVRLMQQFTDVEVGAQGCFRLNRLARRGKWQAVLDAGGTAAIMDAMKAHPSSAEVQEEGLHALGYLLDMGGEAVLGAKLREAVPGMNEASESVIRLLGELCSTTSGAGRSLKGWCVGGFSQGSMMACSVVSRLGLADQDRTMFQDNILSPGGLLILSGMPMNINEWVTGFQVCQFILFLFLFISQSFIDGLIVVFICTDFIENKFLYIFFFLLFFDLSSIKKEKVFKCYNFMVQMI